MRKVFVFGAIALLLSSCSSVQNTGEHLTSFDDSTNKYAESREDILSLFKESGDRVFFSFDSSELSDDAKCILEKQAELIKQYSNVEFVIEGHCDPRGTQEYNIALGHLRADSVLRYLVGCGVKKEALTAISYGKERRASNGTTKEAYTLDRRAVITIK